jgi:uncharacterized membrane protein
MDTTTLLAAMVGAALLGLLATVAILRRSASAASAAAEHPFAVSTEGMSRCPSCGMGNLVSDSTCSSCGKRLPG